MVFANKDKMTMLSKIGAIDRLNEIHGHFH